MVKKIVILGSTGSIGTQALDVIRKLPKTKFTVIGLSTFSNLDLLKKQIKEFRPKIAAVWKDADKEKLSSWCKKSRLNTKVVSGIDGLTAAARYQEANLILTAVVGAIGIKPIIEAIKCRKMIALANKEALVTAGPLIMAEAEKRNVRIIPVDSEHSAIFQCVKNEPKRFIKRIFLTASGGPFYKTKEDYKKISVKKALAHPTWKMGKKITIDSATLMNKGLEAIEASHLFGIGLDNIEIVIHPQSIVHSLVEFTDGSVIAQLSNPDMRLPIQFALTFPDRLPSSVKKLDLKKIKFLYFDAPDFKRFPCLNLAIKAGKAGGSIPAVMNAANEIAVENFLKGGISFDKIPEIVRAAVAGHKKINNPSLDQIIAADKTARQDALEYIQNSRLKIQN